MYLLTCPACGKMLARADSASIAPMLHMWCRRCKAEVTPVGVLVCDEVRDAEPESLSPDTKG
jgi:predicted amidophosphoribosyltransferase